MVSDDKSCLYLSGTYLCLYWYEYPYKDKLSYITIYNSLHVCVISARWWKFLVLIKLMMDYLCKDVCNLYWYQRVTFRNCSCVFGNILVIAVVVFSSCCQWFLYVRKVPPILCHSINVHCFAHYIYVIILYVIYIYIIYLYIILYHGTSLQV